MEFLEKDLEQIIWETDNELLQDREFWICGKKHRQLKIGNYGIADIVTFNRMYDVYRKPFLEVTIYELKKEKISMSSFLQAVRYTKGIQEYFAHRGLFEEKVFFNIVLCGKSIDTASDFIFLADLMHNATDYIIPNSINSLRFYTYKYNFNGIMFEEIGSYRLKNNGF